MASNVKGKMVLKQREEATKIIGKSCNSSAISKTIPTNCRPVYEAPKYTLPIYPKPETDEQKIIYEKEILLSIVAKPEESWEEREARLSGRRRSLEVAATARWGANLRDLDMLEAERQRWKEYDEAKARNETL